MAVKFCLKTSRFCRLQRGTLLTLTLLIGTIFVSAQTPTPTPAEQTQQPIIEDDTGPVKIKTDLVTLTLTVTDLYGRYVSGLKKEAFTVFDEKDEQEITFFSDANDVP